ncbi:hypothetical protein BLA50215_07319 [Burkholderia lata]|nr:hypothetical protein BLA50215_07319 [Burkholderia lata]
MRCRCRLADRGRHRPPRRLAHAHRPIDLRSGLAVSRRPVAARRRCALCAAGPWRCMSSQAHRCDDRHRYRRITAAIAAGERVRRNLGTGSDGRLDRRTREQRSRANGRTRRRCGDRGHRASIGFSGRDTALREKRVVPVDRVVGKPGRATFRSVADRATQSEDRRYPSSTRILRDTVVCSVPGRSAAAESVPVCATARKQR